MFQGAAAMYASPRTGVLSAATIAHLADVYYNDPYVRRCADVIKAAIRTKPIEIYKDGMHQIPVAWFARVLESEWKRFNEDWIDTRLIVGVVPVIPLVTDDDTVIPRIPGLGTYDIICEYDARSEDHTYVVTRTVGSGGNSFFGNQHGLTKASTSDHVISSRRSQAQQARAQYGDLNNGEYNPVVDETGEDLGPSAYDPAENRARRLDMGLMFPEMMEPDRACTVFRGFGSDPSPTGEPRSIVAACIAAKVRYETYCNMATRHALLVASQTPFLESEGYSKDYIELLAKGETIATSVTDEPTGSVDAGFVRTAKQMLFKHEQMKAAQERQRGQARPVPSLNVNPLAQQSGVVAALSSNERMRAYAFSALAQNEEQPYIELPPGSKVVQVPVSGSFPDLTFMTQSYEEIVANLFRLPIALFRNLASTQGNVELQNNYLRATESQWIKELTQVNSSIYWVIYGDEDTASELGYAYQYALHQDVVRELRRTFDAADRREKLSIARRLLLGANDGKRKRGETEDSSHVLLARIKGAQDHYKTDGRWNASQATRQMRQHTNTPEFLAAAERSKGRTRFHKPDDHVSRLYEPYSTQEQLAQVEAMLSHTVQEAMGEPDEQLADLSIEHIFMQAIERLQRGRSVKLFEQGDEQQQAWISKRKQKTKNKLEQQWEHESREQASRYIVTYTTNSTVPLEEMVQMHTLGLLNTHELKSQVRARMNLPVQCDNPVMRADQKNPLDKFRDIMASKTIEKLLEQSTLGGVLDMTRENIEKDKKEAVEGEKQKADMTLEKERMKNTVALEKEKLKQKAAGGAGEHKPKRKA